MNTLSSLFGRKLKFRFIAFAPAVVKAL